MADPCKELLGGRSASLSPCFQFLPGINSFGFSFTYFSCFVLFSFLISHCRDSGRGCPGINPALTSISLMLEDAESRRDQFSYNSEKPPHPKAQSAVVGAFLGQLGR